MIQTFKYCTKSECWTFLRDDCKHFLSKGGVHDSVRIFVTRCATISGNREITFRGIFKYRLQRFYIFYFRATNIDGSIVRFRFIGQSGNHRFCINNAGCYFLNYVPISLSTSSNILSKIETRDCSIFIHACRNIAFYHDRKRFELSILFIESLLFRVSFISQKIPLISCLSIFVDLNVIEFSKKKKNVCEIRYRVS